MAGFESVWKIHDVTARRTRGGPNVEKKGRILEGEESGKLFNDRERDRDFA